MALGELVLPCFVLFGLFSREHAETYVYFELDVGSLQLIPLFHATAVTTPLKPPASPPPHNITVSFLVSVLSIRTHQNFVGHENVFENQGLVLRVSI